MGRAASRNDARLRAIVEQLEVVRPDGPSAIEAALSQLRELAGTEALACMCPAQSTSGWVLERFFADNLPNAMRFRTLLASYLTRGGDRFGFFDPHAIEPAQRNVLVDVTDGVPAKEREASRIYVEVLRPLRLHQHHISRALLCEGASLLGWFGAFHGSALTRDQRAILEAALPALRRRLAIERQLETAPLASAALDAVLEHIAAPAFVVSARGRIFEVNEAARALLATRRAEIAAAIVATLAGEPTSLALELTPLDDRGAPDHWLAVLRVRGADSRITHAIARVASRLDLTRRQREVLARVVVGESNATIASGLKISERAVEQHITALFDRTAVDSRAALVTYVLLG